MAARLPLLLLLCALLPRGPAHAWYKQAASPGYRSVGRASGLLAGLRRSPFVRRAADEEPSPSRLAETRAPPFSLKTTPTCIRNVVPNPSSCELLFGHKTRFKCKADVFLSLDSADCARH